jgi:hypothetical protein
VADRGRFVALLTIGLVIVAPVTVLAKTAIDWVTTEPLTGTVQDGELFVEAEGPGTYPLIALDDPGVQPPRFQVDGTVRHEGVDSTAYFEMWTVLPDQSRYFTRTLAEAGPMGIMSGDSETRPFTLPFELGEGGPVPVRLEINLVTEGSGRFWVGPLAIASAVEGEEATTTSTTEAPTTTGQAAPVVTTVPTDQEEGGGSGLWWGLGALVVVGGAGFAWLRSSRRKRAEEQRKMSAMDTLRY